MAEAKLEIADELIVAYVDDELDRAQRALVSSVIAGDPAIRRRADEMRLSRNLLREAFPLSPQERVPASIEAAANRLAEACAERSRRPPDVLSLFQSRWRAVFGTALALGLVASMSYLAWHAGRASNDGSVTALLQINPDTALYDALESTPSAEVINVPAEGAAVRAILTFQAKDGRFCREFEVLSHARGSTGIACREAGIWRAEVLLNSAATAPDSNYYTPAAGSNDSALAAVADRLMEADPFSVEQEARVMASRWRTSHAP